MRLAPSRTRELSWSQRETEEGRNWPVVCYPSLHPRYTVPEKGGVGQCCSPKAKRRTERCDSFPSFDTCTFVLLPSSLQPHLVRVLFGLLLSFLVVFGFVCFFFGLRLFLVSSYKKKSVTPAALTKVCPSFGLSQCTHPSQGGLE